MNFVPHITIALLVGLALFWGLGAEGLALATLVLLTGLAGILPDADHQSSVPRGLLNKAVLLFALFIVFTHLGFEPTLEWGKNALILFLAIFGVYFIIVILFLSVHRGITHTIRFALFVALAFFLIDFNYLHSLAGFVGVLVHLALDSQIRF
jgi:membrane-bound metal-dependent hydrolase YbcI (DUF457 family)